MTILADYTAATDALETLSEGSAWRTPIGDGSPLDGIRVQTANAVRAAADEALAILKADGERSKDRLTATGI
jgi:hypothetical protein